MRLSQNVSISWEMNSTMGNSKKYNSSLIGVDLMKLFQLKDVLLN
jgi:hypothetical protein